jgi:hypothetical protein
MDGVMKKPNATRSAAPATRTADIGTVGFATVDFAAARSPRPADGAAPARLEGETDRKTQHGPARCTWRNGKPAAAHNVLMPNGARGEAQVARFGAVDGWRRPVGKTDPTVGGWIFGTVELSEHDAVFLDDQTQPAPVPPVSWGYPDLECDLWTSADIGAATSDRRYALALCRLLEQRTWRYAFGGLWQSTAPGAGAIVANLRGRGENHHDYQPRPDHPPAADALTAFFDQKIEAALSRIGWHTMPSAEFDSLERSARARLAEWEARPEGARPAWYLEDRTPQNAVAATHVGALIQRIHELAAADRITQQEWLALFARLHGEA